MPSTITPSPSSVISKLTTHSGPHSSSNFNLQPLAQANTVTSVPQPSQVPSSQHSISSTPVQPNPKFPDMSEIDDQISALSDFDLNNKPESDHYFCNCVNHLSTFTPNSSTYLSYPRFILDSRAYPIICYLINPCSLI